MIRNFLNNGKKRVIPHVIFESAKISEIKKDIKLEKLKKDSSGNGFERINNRQITKIVLSTDETMVMESSFSNYGLLLHNLKVELVEKINEFDITLFNVDQSNIHITEMK